MDLYPLVLDPAYKDYVWGGSRIPALFDRPLPPGIYAESWELSDRAEGMSHIANGVWKGAPLADLVARGGDSLLGRGRTSAAFPLLVKLIDARERLSIQVHPDDASATAGFGEAKTEAWHILHAQPGAQVFAGLKPGTTDSGFLAALRENRLEDCLQAFPVTAGDTIFIPGGRIHAICEGLVLLEVQQNSNTTYRVYDWGRVGKDGKPRDLHLEQALRVIRWEDPAPVTVRPRLLASAGSARVEELVACAHFVLERLDLVADLPVHHGGSSFHALFTQSGALDVSSDAGTVRVPRGRTCLIPAALNRYTLTPAEAPARVLRVSLPGDP
jgi:mannose-6-phosphate isomerase